MSSDREFRVVMRGPSTAIFRPNYNLVFERFPTKLGPVTVAYATRWLKQSETVTVPGHMWIEVRGCAPDLETAIGPFADAGLAGIPVIATSSNAAVNEPEIELAFESTQCSKEREYFQSFIPPESNILHTSRVVDAQATVTLIDALKVHPDRERLLRAINQYNLSLQNWKFGRATIALAHLWMAAEALTKVRIRAECTARKLFTSKELATVIGVEIGQLDAAIRRDFILRGDKECYKEAKEASDGFEHGYLRFDRILQLSRQVRHRMAGYVRTEIFDLAVLNDDAKARLLSEPFAKPLGPSRVAKYLRGTLIGEVENMASSGNEYPFIRWATKIKKCEFDIDGKLQIQLKEILTPELATGVAFKPISMETWQLD